MNNFTQRLSTSTPPNAPLHLRINTPIRAPQLHHTPPKPPISTKSTHCHSCELPASRASKIPASPPAMAPPAPKSGAAGLLARQLKEMQSDKNLPGISCGLVNDSNVFEWEVMLMISDDCKYYGGANFRANLSFPQSYPLMPPTMTFLTPVPFHPNVYPSGAVCISILHPPEDDKYGYESASERWSPVQSPETILISVISLLHSPNDESPANVEAAVLWREEQKEGGKEFRRRTRKCVRESLGED
ncbi:hypothetical protein V496_01306 [Pseudogymnoascus sp. VKM F-4515 (FW-2607)]|nr:hypothetical protein V496_01306 [Pseudogymnoascus sp. VKM F-4515 (FW-2607)]